MRLPISNLHRIRRPSSSSSIPHTHQHPTGSPPPNGRSTLNTSRPASPSIGNQDQNVIGNQSGHGRNESVDTSNQSVFQLFKEDYTSCRIYMKEMDYRDALRKALRRHMYKWYAILVIAIVLTALITSKHETIVEFCAPVTRTIRGWPGGWLIPLALLIVVSFPPLVGHEIIGILCGLVYGLGVGFAILAAGTFLGEIATWIAFKWCCQGRASKFEKKNALYASLTQLIREKSFTFTLVLRFSAVPGHIVTAVSASAGANFWMYLAAAFLTLPKQFTIVYLGKAFGTKSRKNTIISIVTTVLTLVGTIVAAVYVYYQMRIVMRRNATMPLPTTLTELDSSINMSEFKDEKRGSIALDGTSNNLYARRPWLFTNSSTLSVNGNESRTPMRSWSMPGHMTEEELREWVKEMEYEQSTQSKLNDNSNTPVIRIDNVSNEGGSGGIFNNLPPVFTPGLIQTPQSQFPVGFSNSSIIPSRSSTPSYFDHDKLISTEDLSSNSSTYPPPLKIGESSTPTPRVKGGREIAYESDLYALSKGAKRPEYQKMRIDSKSNLINKTTYDDSALMDSSPSWKKTYTRSRGDSGVSLISKPTNEDLGEALSNWKRDYGRSRSRGDSGAALLGRPGSVELGVSRKDLITGNVKGEESLGEDDKGFEILKDIQEDSN